ncbi:MAG: dephospho-CoA kinase [Solirubrobacterales bacterium]
MDAGRERPPFIGLTGAIASGKSTALAELNKLGAATLSTDQVVHDLYEDPLVVDQVAERLGADVLAPDGSVDREAVAAAVFAEPEARSWLEQMIWPLVGKKIFEFKTAGEAMDPPPRAIVVEVPLLFESGMDQAFDQTVAIVLADETRKQRAVDRGTGISELDARDERQMSSTEKSERADYEIVNDGTLDELRAQLGLMLDVFAVVGGG